MHKKIRLSPALARALMLLVSLLLVDSLAAQQLTVTAQIEVEGPGNLSHLPKDVVVWLTPPEGSAPIELTEAGNEHPSLTQKNKSFSPHLLVVEVGTVVAFPNRDPFFHNVFSLFEGKRFDLGLYEAGTTRHVRFDRPGVCYVFCNIHPEMSAVVVVVDTPYHGITNRHGRIEIAKVPAGSYTLHVWDERSLPETLASLTRQVTISPGHSSLLPKLHIRETEVVVAHKNKYGQDYEKPAPPAPGYIPQNQ
jgi:plastocyanin